jgi:hypothetical protein
MLRLLKACCQGGNDKVATLFASASAMIGVEECCHALLAHCLRKPALSPRSPSAAASFFPALGDEDNGSEDGKGSADPSPYISDGDKILRILAPPSRFIAGAESHVVKSNQLEKVKEPKRQFSNAVPKMPFVDSHGPSISFFGSPKKQTEEDHHNQQEEADHLEVAENKTTEEEVHVKVGGAAFTSSECFEDGSLVERGAFEVLALLVELVDLLPLSASQLRSPLLWECVSTVVLPAVDELAHRRGLSEEADNENDDDKVQGERSSSNVGSKNLRSRLASDRIVCAELVDLMDRLLTRIDHHNLIDGETFSFIFYKI